MCSVFPSLLRAALRLAQTLSKVQDKMVLL